jgi:hypothetical protein
MATTRKKLSRAKAEAAHATLASLLADTNHDPRLSAQDRLHYSITLGRLQALTTRLRHDECRT